jgi:chlorobactene glucosyltransferase
MGATDIWLYLLIAAAPALALGVTTFNLFVWPRGRAGGDLESSVSVLIPARDEEATIGACVRSVFAADHDVEEVIVYDDGSSDRTPRILETLAERFPRLRVVRGRSLPSGWVGKPHACHHLACSASGDVLVFLDADTRLREGGLSRLLSLLAGRPEVGLASVVPRQEMPGAVPRLVMPLLHLTYTSWLPLSLIWRSDNPRFLAVNGQTMALRREALDDVGGFEAVCDAIVDDMALARALKEAGHGVVFGDGHHVATCRMYDSGAELWRGFSKNLYEGIGATGPALAAVVVLYLWAFVAPYAAAGLAWGLGAAALWGPALAGIGANLVLRGLLAARFRHPVDSALLHPLGVLVVVAIAANSWRWHRREAIHWAGRTYAGGKRLQGNQRSETP